MTDIAIAQFRYTLRSIPAFTDRNGCDHAACTNLTLVCSRGLRWDGGEFTSREAAIAAADAKGYTPLRAAQVSA